MLAEGEQNNGTTNAVRSIRLCVRVRALSVQLRVWYGHTTYLFL